jgi:hypothetical protein
MVLDFRKVRPSEAAVAIGGIVLIVVMSLADWFAIRQTGLLFQNDADGTIEVGRNAFQSFSVTDIVLLVTALSAIALPIVLASSYLPKRDVRVDWAVAALGLLACALLVFRMISVPDIATTVEGVTVRVSDYPGAEVIRKAGVWLGLALSIVIAVGAAKAARDPAGPS